MRDLKWKRLIETQKDVEMGRRGGGGIKDIRGGRNKSGRERDEETERGSFIDEELVERDREKGGKQREKRDKRRRERGGQFHRRSLRGS